jgi:hypothetical protein
MVSTFYGIGHSAAHDSTTPAPQAETQRFLTANGSRDSHAIITAKGERNRSPRAGKPYGRVSWDDIRRMVDDPAATEKNDAPFVILSTYADHDGRTHEIQRNRGVFGGLAVDIDSGNPELDDVVAAVTAVTGGATAMVYSSSSASPAARKWRVLIPLAAPISGADYADTQAALFDLLKSHGIVCDFTLTRAAQPIYLPNVPPARRRDDGEPAFYQSTHLEGHLLDLAPGSAIITAREALRVRAGIQQAEAETKRAAYLERKQAAGDALDPVEHFNAHHSIAEAFARYRFVQDPKHPGHYQSPLSESKSFSTWDRGDHWITVSNWANKHGVGRPTKSGHRSGTAFDLFVHFEHEGNRRAAIRAYAVEVGIDFDGLDPMQPVVVEAQPDRGEVRHLDEWRSEVEADRALALRMPGLHHDRSQTGSGKTTATNRAILRAMETTRREAEHDDDVTPITRILTALPDHANIRERVAELRADGRDAVAYPERNESTCGNLEAVRRAEGLGLIAGAAVCWNCPLRDSCLYQKQVKEAEQAAEAFCTHARLILSPGRTTRERDAIVIDENPEAVLAPSITVRVDDFAPVVALASTVRDECLFRRGRVMEPTAEERAFAGLIVGAYDLIVKAAQQATEPGVVEVPLPTKAEVPDHWQSTILRWAAETNTSPGHDPRKVERFQKSLRLLTMIVTGGLERLHLLVDQTNRHRLAKDGTVEEWQPLHHFVVGSWKTRLPNVPILTLCATTDAADLRAATGREVRDCTPAGHLPNVTPVTQIPWDVEKGDEPSTAAGFVEAFLDAHPEVNRLGLIGHQGHVRAMMDDDDILAPRLRARVAKSCYFGQGPDRASNDWHETCDAMLIVGTLRPGGGPVKERLVIHGKVEAARRSGDWGPRHWEATTTDGRKLVVEGKGYRDPDWHQAHASISRAAVHQAAGRGRAITDKGIPVWIVSDEPMGCPVDDSLEPVTPVVREVVEAVIALRDGGARPELFPIDNSYRLLFGSRTAVRVAAVIDWMQAAASRAGRKLGRRGAEKRLALAARHGRLERPARGWLLVSGGAPDVAPEARDAAARLSSPSTATVALPPQSVVITTHAQTAPAHAVEVAARSSPETTTSVCTSTVTTSGPPVVDALLEQAEERAAILEFDGRHDRETAERLADEMVMGRGVSEPIAPAEDVGVDHRALAARLDPLVARAVDVFGGGRVVLLEGEDDGGFRRRPRTADRPPGACTCGSTDVVDVPIPGGRGVRQDCRKCDRFIRFSVWHGKREPGPTDHGSPPAAVETPTTSGGVSFDFLPVGSPPGPAIMLG